MAALLLECAVDGCPGSVIGLGELTKTLPTLSIPEDAGSIQIERLATDVPTFQPGRLQTLSLRKLERPG